MRNHRIGNDRVLTQYIKFYGGIDTETPVLSIKPGHALDAMNYEPGLMGGYKRIDGYERMDGRPAPSSATYLYLECASLVDVPFGVIVEGDSSGATGYVCKLDVATGSLCLTNVVGTFVVGDVLEYGATPIGEIIAPPAPQGYRDSKSDALALAGAADVYRARIQKVPGQGPIRGVWVYNGFRYAFRDKAGGASGGMYRATASGWQEVAFPLEEVRFTNANASVTSGVLTQGAVTATIQRVIVESGTLESGTNTGRLILSSRSGGAFSAGAATTTSSGSLTLSGAQASITLPAGGRYEFVNTNFGGSSGTYRMYFCNGVGRAFEFNGAVAIPIGTGLANDIPKHIAAHKGHLFLSQDSSVMFSGDGDPFAWQVISGAGEIAVGAPVTGFAIQAGDTIAIFTRNSSHQLNGSTVDDFQLLPISNETGAIEYTVQTMGKTYALDDRGIVSTDRTLAYGNFNQSSLTSIIQPMVDAFRSKAIGSGVYRSRGEYRLYGNDGSGIIATFAGNDLVGFSRFQYPITPTCIACVEDNTGDDIVLIGGADGFVYQADRGSSFDGQSIEAYLRMPFNNVNSPRIRKRFRRVVMEMTAKGYCAIRFQPEFTYGDYDIATHRTMVGEIAGTGGYWDAATWDEFFYDARMVSSPEFQVTGRGLNMSMLFYSDSNYDLGHNIQGVIIHYSLGRLAR
jgi:hypothetical protein